MEISTNTPKKFPLHGVGEYFEKLGKLNHAKYAYTKALNSPAASAIDKLNAQHAINRVDKSLREVSLSTEDPTIPAYLPVSDLKPHPDVNLAIGARDYKRLVDNIRERGIKDPLTVDTQNRVICGIQRLRAAKEIGLKEVPCTILQFYSSADIKRYSISDNLCRRHLSERDKKALAVELKRLRVGASVKGRKKNEKKDKE